MLSGSFGVSPLCSSSLIDNERVTVWDVTSGDPFAPPHAGDTVWISLSRPGEVAYKSAGQHFDPASLGGRAIVIDLKDHPVPPLPNASGYPNAFPRAGVKKLFENGRVVVWDYRWTPRVPTPMHFHDKDVVVVYVETGALKSTTVDGQSTANEFTAGTVRFNARNRVHSELLTSERARAIITELK
ncbi:MAG TPA: hypothetical protein VGY57_13435 [Vicinamibacterales bacterium]|nr:hypothetical protein [Vicinamibacterales bacterium]